MVVGWPAIDLALGANIGCRGAGGGWLSVAGKDLSSATAGVCVWTTGAAGMSLVVEAPALAVVDSVLEIGAVTRGAVDGPGVGETISSGIDTSLACAECASTKGAGGTGPVVAPSRVV